MAKVKTDAIEKSRKVYDADAGKFIELSPDFQRRAMQAFQTFGMFAIVEAMQLKDIVDNKYYLVYHDSKDEFLSNLPNMGRSQAYKYLKVAENFNSVFGKKLIGENADKFIEGASENEKKLLNLDIGKLMEIGKLDDKEIQQLAKNGRIEGTDIEIDDIVRSATDELTKKFAKDRKKYTDKIADLEEENKLQKEEKRIMEEKIKLAENRLKSAEELEKKYGPKASTKSHKESCLRAASQYLNDFLEEMTQANITTDDPESLQLEVAGIIKKLNQVTETVSANYEPVVSQF